MTIWKPICWLTSHDWIKKFENKNKLVEECSFCGEIREIYKWK